MLRAVQEVEDALALEYHLGEESKRLVAAVTAQKQVLAISLTLYRDGATTFLDVVVAQTTLLNQQRTQLGLLTQQLGTGVSLAVALGGGWASPVQVTADNHT